MNKRPPNSKYENGHTICCGYHPVLRRVDEFVEYKCFVCPRKGGRAEDEEGAGWNWEMMWYRVKSEKLKKSLDEQIKKSKVHL